MIRMAFRQWLSLRAGTDEQTAHGASPAAGAWTAPNAPSTLHWRAPWRTCQVASWTLATVTAPTFWLTGLLLAINSRSDHPAFWVSLMGIVAFVNAATIMRINQRQHRCEYACRETLARHYLGMSQRMGAALFLACGWASGFLPDLTLPAAHAHASLAAVSAALMWNVLLAWLFSLGSFAHAGVVHARIGFAYQARLPRA